MNEERWTKETARPATNKKEQQGKTRNEER